MLIGIDSSNKKCVNHDFINKQHNKSDAYGYYRDESIHTSKTFGSWYGKKWEIGDTVSMELNVKTKTLEFYQNDESQGIDMKILILKMIKYIIWLYIY